MSKLSELCSPRAASRALSLLVSPAVLALSAEGCKWTKIRENLAKQGKKLTPEGEKKLAAMSAAELAKLKNFDAFCMSQVEEPALSLLAFSGAAFYALPMIEGVNNTGTVKDGKNPAGPEALTTLKDVLGVGKYKHPIHGWTLDVTPETIKNQCAAFFEMKANGVRVPTYQDHKPGAATCMGYTTDLFQGGTDAIKRHPAFAKLPVDKAPLDPNHMYAVQTWNSPEAMAMAKGVGQVSVLIDKKFKDGMGKKYGGADGVVRHIGVTPEPIVPGQDGFTQLAASLFAENQTGLYALAS